MNADLSFHANFFLFSCVMSQMHGQNGDMHSLDGDVVRISRSYSPRRRPAALWWIYQYMCMYAHKKTAILLSKNFVIKSILICFSICIHKLLILVEKAKKATCRPKVDIFYVKRPWCRKKALNINKRRGLVYCMS